MPPRLRRLLCLTLFALAMAYLEAAVVVYMRILHYPDNPLIIFPMRLLPPSELVVELIREAATLVMIFSVAMLAERGALRVFAAFAYVFGLWDIFYYVWLKATLAWPVSWWEWDVLFLIPWPWFGPWISAAAIAFVFASWAAWVLANEGEIRLRRTPTLLFVAGAILSLRAYLQPVYDLLPLGEAGFADYRPGEFGWFWYLSGVILMVAGLIGSRPRKCLETQPGAD